MNFKSAQELIADSDRVLGFTGAGVSTESKIPDFRSPGGVWSKYRNVTYQEFLAEESGQREFWRQQAESWPQMRAAQPNPSHAAFVALQRRGKLLGVITQNIDGLHQRAGLPAGAVAELHGTTWTVSCLDCDLSLGMDEAVARVNAGEPDPRCRICGGHLKPDIVMFGQSLPEAVLTLAEAWCGRAEAVIAAGSSLEVQPAASFPLWAKRQGARLIIVNLTPTPYDDLADLVVRETTGTALPRLCATAE